MPIRRDLTDCDGVLTHDEIHVWHADLAIASDYLKWLHGFLDRDEQDRASRFKVRAAREEFVASHAFVRMALGKYLGVDPQEVQFQITRNGKPALMGDSDLRFNLSHTDRAAVLAVTRNCPVGVDVERIRQDVDAMQLAERFFSTAEVDWLRSQPRSERIQSFFACWTAKEAYIKVSGAGLSAPLAQFSAIPGNHGELRLEIFDSARHFQACSMWQLDLGASLRCALAVQDENQDFRVRLGPWRWPEMMQQETS